MASPERLSFDAPKNQEQQKIIIVDGFAQRGGDVVTHQMAAALERMVPGVIVENPLATAEMLSDDTTVQLPFHEQATRLHDLVAEDSDTPTHIIAYSQGGIATGEAFGMSPPLPQVKSITFVGTPLEVERERDRVSSLGNAGDMGGAFEHVMDQMYDRGMGYAALAGVAYFEPRNNTPLSVGLTEAYLDSFPDNATHFARLGDITRNYRTTLVSMEKERVTDCTPENAELFGLAVDIPFVPDVSSLSPDAPRQGIVLPNAPHRLGEFHRTQSMPGIIQVRALARKALAGVS